MHDAPAPIRAEDARETDELLANLERELGVQGASAVFRKALAIAKEACRTGEHSGFGGAGVRAVIGSRKDIDLVRRWCEQASTIPYLKDRIKAAESRAAAAEAEVARLRGRVMPHMCRDDHAEIRHAVSDDDERCPVCRERDRTSEAEAEVARLAEKAAVLEGQLRAAQHRAASAEARYEDLCNGPNG